MFKVPSTGDRVFLNKISFLLPGHIVNFIISRLAPGAKLNTFAKFSVISGCCSKVSVTPDCRSSTSHHSSSLLSLLLYRVR